MRRFIYYYIFRFCFFLLYIIFTHTHMTPYPHNKTGCAVGHRCLGTERSITTEDRTIYNIIYYSFIYWSAGRLHSHCTRVCASTCIIFGYIGSCYIVSSPYKTSDYNIIFEFVSLRIKKKKKKKIKIFITYQLNPLRVFFCCSKIA